MIKFTVLTLFPELINEFKNTSIIKKAINDGCAQINIVDIKEFGIGKRKNVDDTVCGGGTGMVMTVPVLDRAIESVLNNPCNNGYENKIVYLSPKGEILKQNRVLGMVSNENINYILLCGHYEGIDERIFSLYDISEISIGDYILTGGEIPAMVLLDTVIRILPGVLKDEATLLESHTDFLLEQPQYTKPGEYKGLKVPDILLSGHHEKIDKYRFEKSVYETHKKRPDLLEKYIEKNDNKNKINNILNKEEGI